MVAAGRARSRRPRLGELRPGLGHRHHEAAQARRRAGAGGRLRPAPRPRARSTGTATWSSPGTAPPRACACRTPTGSPTSGSGLAICDATSAVFAMDVPIAKLDVVTYSWQKVLGGEAQHGVLILSPRAVERLETLQARLAAAQDLPHDQGRQVHRRPSSRPTPSTRRRCSVVEDALDGLQWAEALGGLPGLIERSEANLAAVAAWVERTPWVEFLAEDPATRSCTSICLKIVDPGSLALGPEERAQAAQEDRVPARSRGRGLRHRPPTAKPLRASGCGAERPSRRSDLEAAVPLAGLGLGTSPGLASGGAAARAPRRHRSLQRGRPPSGGAFRATIRGPLSLLSGRLVPPGATRAFRYRRPCSPLPCRRPGRRW